MSRPYPVAIVVEEVLHWCYTNGKGAFVYGSHMYVFQRHIWHIVFCVCCAGITCPTADVVPASAATKPMRKRCSLRTWEGLAHALPQPRQLAAAVYAAQQQRAAGRKHQAVHLRCRRALTT